MAEVVDAKEAFYRLSEALCSIDSAAEVLERDGQQDVAAVLRKAHKAGAVASEFLQCIAYPAKVTG